MRHAVNTMTKDDLSAPRLLTFQEWKRGADRVDVNKPFMEALGEEWDNKRYAGSDLCCWVEDILAAFVHDKAEPMARLRAAHRAYLAELFGDTGVALLMPVAEVWYAASVIRDRTLREHNGYLCYLLGELPRLAAHYGVEWPYKQDARAA